MSGCRAERRLLQEIMELEKPKNKLNGDVFKIDIESVYSNIFEWIVDVNGAPGTLYENEQFKLLFKFSPEYPIESPEVTFTGQHIPIHPHIYSNGHICLSILYDDWSPAFTVESVILSIVSMLSSCKKKVKPDGHDYYVRYAPQNPKQTKWDFHDEKA